ncbi:MAG TPA: hypothetical protein VE173_10365, partial [Longimicrobiales bacterium]|nr:hypothetical protein [Longimicrobiales bacterium]
MRASPRWRLVALLSLVGLLAVPNPASAAHNPPPPCEDGAYLTLTGAGTLQSIICSGETAFGVELQGIPDGIGFRPGAEAGTVDVYVNHEETHVPFFGTADFQDASVTGWTLNGDGEIVGAEVAIPSSAGYLRFCSSFMAGPGEGFSTYTYFTNEETNDVVDVPSGVPYRPDPSVAPQRQAGYAVALNTDTGEYTQIAGMGRYNHENTVAIPGGWNQFALLSTDDTFSAPSSQLYMYLANQEQHIWQDKGSLWAFQVTRTDEGRVDPFDPYNGANDYLDIDPGDDWQGRFIRVPEEIAKGLTN